MERRQIRYLIRVWHHLDPDEVEAWPWWKRREFEEGIAWQLSGFGRMPDDSGDDLDSLESKGYTVRRKG